MGGPPVLQVCSKIVENTSIGRGKGRLCLAARERDILGNCERHWAGTTFPPFVSGDCLLNAVFALLSIGSCSFQPGEPFNPKGTQ